MHNRRRGRGWTTVAEPVDHAIHLWEVIRFGANPTISPSLHLPFEKALRPTENRKAGLRNVNCMQADQAVDERFAYALRTVRQRRKFHRKLVTQDESMSALHHEESRAQRCLIFTQMKNPGSL